MKPPIGLSSATLLLSLASGRAGPPPRRRRSNETGRPLARRTFPPYLASCESTGGPMGVVSSSDIRPDQCQVLRHFSKLNFDEVYDLVRFWTMQTRGRLEIFYDAIGHITHDAIPGAIVECGVWKGGATMAMMLSNIRHNVDREFWLYDTFDGVPEPTKRDGKEVQDIWEAARRGEDKKREKTRRVDEGKWCYGPQDVVRNNLRYTQYPEDKIHMVKGKVEETLPTGPLPDKIAILILDTDLYLSTKVILEVLYERLQPGGLLVVDDFYTWPGPRLATYEFFEKIVDPKGWLETLRCPRLTKYFFCWKWHPKYAGQA